MRCLPLLLILLLFTALGSDARLGAADSPDEPGAEIVSGDLGRRLDALFAGSDQDRFDGAVLVARGGQVLLRKGYGLADPKGRNPVRPDTVFCIGSNTKPFTAAAILRLEQAGKLRVEAPLTDFFDHVPADKKRITLHHLLTHSSGLGEYHDQPGEGGDFAVMTRDEAVRRILVQKLKFEPGTGSAYSNCGFTLLAVVIEKVSGQTYEQFLREQLFEPAGMVDTGFYGEKRWDAKRLAFGSGPEKLGDNLPSSWPGITWALKGSGGIVSTVGDQYRWHQALRGDKLLSKASKEKAFKIHVPEGTKPGGTGYAWFVAPTRQKTFALRHSGASDYGFRSVIVSYPEEDACLVGMTCRGESPRLVVGLRGAAKLLFPE